jgi:hypothetical protein
MRFAFTRGLVRGARRARAIGACAAALAVVAAVITEGRAEACAPVMREGASIRVVGEEALIVWDPVHQIEHFVRRGDFETDAPSFGFLVPTPSVPTLTAATEAAFGRLGEAIRPEVRRVRRWTIAAPLCLGMLMLPQRSMQVTAGQSVRVLSQTRVAGYDAAVLEASDAAALTEWLRAHDYPSRPALVSWLAPYVADRWKITAFKVAKQGETDTSVGLQAVRLTFASDAPFYPYREPEDATDSPGRSLRVFLVTPGRMEGRLGAERTPWPATLEYARPVRRAATLLAGALPESLVPAGAWLSSYLDLVSRRPAADLFFARAESQSEVVPPPDVHEDLVEIPFPAEPLLLTAALLWWRRRRRRQRARADGG